MKVFRTDKVIVDIEDEKTRKIKGSFAFSFLSDEAIFISGLRGKEVFSSFTSNMGRSIIKTYPSVKVAFFTMEESLFEKLFFFSDLDYEVIMKTKVSGKVANFVKVQMRK